MRASHIDSNLHSLAALGPEREQAILEQVPEGVRAVEESSRVSWLPLELDVQLTDAVERVCGRERMKRWARDAILRSSEGWLLRPVVVGLSALGLTPQGALKRVPTGWSLVYRDCGSLRYERADARGITLVHDDVPDAMLENLTYLEGIAGAFEGIAEIGGGARARSTVEVDPEQHRVLYHCAWES